MDFCQSQPIQCQYLFIVMRYSFILKIANWKINEKKNVKELGKIIIHCVCIPIYKDLKNQIGEV